MPPLAARALGRPDADCLADDDRMHGLATLPLEFLAAEIKGIQSQHVIATAKHFVANNQEVQRSSTNVVAGQKTRHEIYAHFHGTISESSLVLEGTVRLSDGGRWIDAVAGDLLYVPVGGVHAFKTSRARRPRCSCCSRRVRPGRLTSRRWHGDVRPAADRAGVHRNPGQPRPVNGVSRESRSAERAAQTG